MSLKARLFGLRLFRRDVVSDHTVQDALSLRPCIVRGIVDVVAFPVNEPVAALGFGYAPILPHRTGTVRVADQFGKCQDVTHWSPPSDLQWCTAGPGWPLRGLRPSRQHLPPGHPDARTSHTRAPESADGRWW